MNRIARDTARHAFMRGRVLGPYPTCRYYPCHFHGQDCTWCFCPFYPCYDSKTCGRMIKRESGKGFVWSCIDCTWIHKLDIAGQVLSALKDHGQRGRLNSYRLLRFRREVLRGR